MIANIMNAASWMVERCIALSGWTQHADQCTTCNWIKSQKRKLCPKGWEFRPTCLWLQPKNDVWTEGLNWTPSPRGFRSRRKCEKLKCELSCWLLMFWKHLCKGSKTLNRALKAFCLSAKGRKWGATPQIGHKNRASSCVTHSSGIHSWKWRSSAHRTGCHWSCHSHAVKNIAKQSNEPAQETLDCTTQRLCLSDRCMRSEHILFWIAQHELSL